MQNVLKSYTSSQLFEVASANPLVFARLLRLPYLVASLLNWRSTSRTLLVQLLGMLEAEPGWLEVPHVALAESLWPELHRETGKNKLTRWLAVLDEDQCLSGMQMILRQKGRYLKTGLEQGAIDFLPSKYKVHQFWVFSEIVGCRMAESGVLELATLKERQYNQRRIVAEVLIDLGGKAVLPEMRDEESKRKQEGKIKGRFEKKLKQAKEGKIEMTRDELFQIESLTERMDVALGQSLMFGQLFFDLAGGLTEYERAQHEITLARKFFDDMAEQSLRERRAAERERREAGERKRLRLVGEKKLVA